MKQLPINWEALRMAFEDARDEFGAERANYFDLENGEVVFVDEEVRSTVECVMDELDEVLDEGADWTDEAIRATAAFQRLSEFEQSSVLAAIKREHGDPGQFEEIPQIDSHEAYEWMQSFVETVADDTTRRRLREAIAQRKPFRRFRDVFAKDRRLERQWHEFEIARQRETMIEWLHSIGVESANPEGMPHDLPPLPDLRRIMFAEVRRFVRFARDIEGVRRIALTGSLATGKEFPKDIDILVTVSDDCDLEPLARLGRQLSGHMNSHRAGADVFLASEDGRYLGRTCPWRDCGPGYRTRCDALHCGARPYLHDDFNAVHMEEEVIAQPPVVLWPNLAAAEGVPRDVREELVERLARDGAT
jgi:predicted nucleotidyltransferase